MPSYGTYIQPNRRYPAKVVRVVDGDTIDVQVVNFPTTTPIRVRLLGLDAPETAHGDKPAEKLAEDAQQFTESLIRQSNLLVQLETDEKVFDDTDQRRMLAYVWLSDGRMLNELLLEHGLAELYTVYPNYHYAERLRAAELRAREAKVGLWADPDFRPTKDMFRPVAPGLSRLAIRDLCFQGIPPAYDDDILPPREEKGGVPTRPDYMRLGDVALRVPPEAIAVIGSAEIDTIQGVRSPHPILSSSGYGQLEVRIVLNTKDLNDINGIPVQGPFGTYWMDGVRPLIAQFKRLPFVPVINSYLNDTWDIHALALSSLLVRTNPGFPTHLTVELTAYPWSPEPFLMVEDHDYQHHFIWPLFRWHYQRLMMPEPWGKPHHRLRPMTGDSRFRLFLLDEAYMQGLEEQKANPATPTEPVWHEVPLRKTRLVSATAGLLNVLTNLRLQGARFPSHQFMGSLDTQLYFELETTDEEDVADLRAMFETTQHYMRRYRYTHFGGHVKIDCEWAHLFGVEYILIDQLHVETVPNFPGLYRIAINARSFTMDQVEQELLKGTTGLPGAITELLTDRKEVPMMHDALAEAALDGFNLYPDLDLPRYKELHQALERIQAFRRQNGLRPIQLAHPILPQGDNSSSLGLPEAQYEWRYCEPDFFMAYDLKGVWSEALRSVSEVPLEDLLPNTAEDPSRLREATVRRVEDDGTISAQLRMPTGWVDRRLRLIGVAWGDGGLASPAPSAEALAWLRQVLTPGKTIYFETDEKTHDESGNMWVYLKTAKNETFLNRQLIERGFAFVEYKAPNVRYLRSLYQAQREAANKGVGLWRQVPDDSPLRDNLKPTTATFPAVDFESASKVRLVEPGAAFPPMDEAELAAMLWHDAAHFDARGRLARAFPTYLLLFVDEGVFVDGRRLWDNYFASHAVVDIEVTEQRLNPVAVLTLRLHDIYGALSTPVYRKEVPQGFLERLGWVHIDAEMIEARKSLLSLRRLQIQPGARVHLRLGYGSMASKLPVVFNGTVVSVERGPEVTMVAESDGRELVNPIPDWADPKNLFERNTGTPWVGWGSEPQDFLVNLLAARGVLFNLTNRWGVESPLGIVHFGLVTKKRGDYPPLSWLPPLFRDADEIGKNIYPSIGYPDELEEGLDPTRSDEFVPPPNALEALKKGWLQGTDHVANEPNMQIILFRKTVWDVGLTLAHGVPDYVFAVHPHQFRSTAFFGLPYWPVRYGFTLDENYRLVERYRPLMQCHAYTTSADLIQNRLRVSSSNIATVCYARYMRGNSVETIDVWADPNIRVDQQKPIFIDTSFVQDWGAMKIPGLNWTIDVIPDILVNNVVQPVVDLLTGKIGSLEFAYRNALWAARATLREAMGRMYTGQISVLGDPTLKVHDVVYLNDLFQAMHGYVGVQTVTHVLSVEDGFVTIFEPRLWATVRGSPLDRWWVRGGLIAAVGASLLYIGLLVKLSRSAAKRIATAPRTLAQSRVASWATAAASRVAQRVPSVARWGRSAWGAMSRALELLRASRAGATAQSLMRVLSTPFRSLLAGAAGIPVTLTLVLGALALADFAARKLVHEFISKERAVRLWPVYLRGIPYVAGIDGQKHLIPGWEDVKLSEELVKIEQS